MCVRRKHSENTTFSLRDQPGFSPHGPTSPCVAAGLLKPQNLAKLLLAGLVSKPQLAAPHSAFGAAFAAARLWDGAERPERFSQRRAFQDSPSILPLQTASALGSAASGPGCVQDSTVREGSGLLLSLSRTEAAATFTNQVLPPPFSSVEPAWEGQALPVACKTAEGEGGTSCSFFQRPVAKDSPGKGKRAQIHPPAHLLLRRMFCHCKGLARMFWGFFLPGEMPQGLKHQP